MERDTEAINIDYKIYGFQKYVPYVALLRSNTNVNDN